MIRQLFGVALEEVTLEHIKGLVEAREEESQHLDFKSQLPPQGAYRDLAKAVSAFANATGGVIVFGISEKNDRAQELTLSLGLSISLSSIESTTNRSNGGRRRSRLSLVESE